jgi:hypothetical protein
MNASILSVGIACVVAGIIGGGLKAFGIEIPLFQSTLRQVCLVIFGVVLIWIGYASTSPKTAELSPRKDETPGTSVKQVEPPLPSAQNAPRSVPDARVAPIDKSAILPPKPPPEETPLTWTNPSDHVMWIVKAVAVATDENEATDSCRRSRVSGWNGGNTRASELRFLNRQLGPLKPNRLSNASRRSEPRPSA